jgi:hypothetical protein
MTTPVKMLARFSVITAAPGSDEFAIYDHVTLGLHNVNTPLGHRQPYVYDDWVALAGWLNERIAGYPVPVPLLGMWSAENVRTKTRRGFHRRGKARRGRKGK